MKIGIITLLGNNYGNRLQNYAVQELLKQYGDEVYTIRYEKDSAKETGEKLHVFKKLRINYISKVIRSRLLNIYNLNNQERSVLRNVLFLLFHKNEIEKAVQNRNREFEEFDKKYIVYEKETLNIHGDDEKEWLSSYDYFVCGSDQIWNPTYLESTRIAFLQFSEKQKRIALAPSFGVSDVSERKEEYRKWIQSIPNLSVREKKGAQIIEALTGRQAEILLDPTMILDKKYWESLIEKVNISLPSKYALCYFLGKKEKNYQKYILEKSKEKENDIVELYNTEFPLYYSFGPDKMICALKNAQVVYTDSFHGVVFSIIFKKQFVLFERSEAGKSMNERLITLLNIFGFQNRVFNRENVDNLDNIIDYSHSDEIIMNERKKAELFLEKAMNILDN